eukprot:TRINITY_DN1013_c0_g1_i1.p1 TRINITY_DN1013_c0_g1~~TRINITY_DN1013_c0_g1_i1.p1  ORF type:complete len:675 (+),score=184.34 TRINITY_DN1013_c0_g1_i1:1-2025(+)
MIRWVFSSLQNIFQAMMDNDNFDDGKPHSMDHDDGKRGYFGEILCHRGSMREKYDRKKTPIVSSLELEDRASIMEEIDQTEDFSHSMESTLADLNFILHHGEESFGHDQEQDLLKEQLSTFSPSLQDVRSIDDYDWCTTMQSDGKICIRSDCDRSHLQHSSLPSICSKHSHPAETFGMEVDTSERIYPSSSSLPNPRSKPAKTQRKTASSMKQKRMRDELRCFGSSADKKIGFPERKIFMEYKLSPEFVWILVDVFEHQNETSLLSKKTVATFCKQACIILSKEILDRTEWWEEDALASRLLSWRVLQGIELISTKDRSIGFVSLEDRLTAIRASGLSTKLLQVIHHMMAHKDLFKSEFVGEVVSITLRCLMLNVGSGTTTDQMNQQHLVKEKEILLIFEHFARLLEDSNTKDAASDRRLAQLWSRDAIRFLSLVFEEENSNEWIKNQYFLEVRDGLKRSKKSKKSKLEKETDELRERWWRVPTFMRDALDCETPGIFENACSILSTLAPVFHLSYKPIGVMKQLLKRCLKEGGETIEKVALCIIRMNTKIRNKDIIISQFISIGALELFLYLSLSDIMELRLKAALALGSLANKKLAKKCSNQVLRFIRTISLMDPTLAHHIECLVTKQDHDVFASYFLFLKKMEKDERKVVRTKLYASLVGYDLVRSDDDMV